MVNLHFDNRFIRELPGDSVIENVPRQVTNALWSPVSPSPVKAPQLIAYSESVARLLGLSDEAMQDPDLVATLGGNKLLPGMVTYATRYGGHQFGHWAGQLGDGRAILLGECINQGQRFELQLKGAGETPYSRRADGRAVLRSSLREFLCSEAMHYLGIPTTRALSLVLTGDQVVRDMFYDGHPELEPGAIVCRVAPSFTRFGHFELLAAKQEYDLLKQLILFTIDRDFTDWQPESIQKSTYSNALIEAWFSEICHRTAILIAHWMRVGFVHGVMNTDNMSILGLTIDYGPYGWIDAFDPGWTPNTTDAQGKRYCFGRQADIARWNLERLGEALSVILPDSNALQEAIHRFDQDYMQALTEAFTGKFGLDEWREEDGDWVNTILILLGRAEIDMTLFFKGLEAIDLESPSLTALDHGFYREDTLQHYGDELQQWLTRYTHRLQHNQINQEQRLAKMRAHNPTYVLRNYLAQEAIDLATQGDYSRIHTLLNLLKHPYQAQEGMETFTQKRPDWAKHKAGCSMLSCSS